MKARVGWLAAAVCLVTLTACSSKDEGHDPTPAPASIGITASSPSVVANGTNTVTVSVSDSGGGPITVTTTRGTFSGGGMSTTIAGAAGTLTLVTCNAQTSTTCAGTATVTATSASGTDSVNVTFGALATVCPSNCAADTGCAGFSCTLSAGGSGTCSATTPSACVAGPACTPSPAGATTETSCSDGIDNDCAGGIDCADTACDGQPCKTGSPSFVCQSGACTDITSGLALTVAPVRTRLPATATATTSVVVTVTRNGAPATGLEVTLAVDALGTVAPTTPVATGADGKATFTFNASGTAGTATLTATLVSVPTFQQTATITMPRLGSLQIPENPGAAQFAVMGAKSSGWNEFGWVQVQVLDDRGEAYPDGLDVVFEHQQLGGSTLGAPVVTTCTTLPTPCVAYTGAISSAGNATETGLARAWLYSGTAAGTLAVTATATADGVTRTVNLPTVAVVGAKASGSNFEIVCSPRNVPALAETECDTSLVDAPFTCAAILKDRFGNTLGRTTQVEFKSEAGRPAVNFATTPAYDPTKDPSSQGDLGTAVDVFDTLTGELPVEVAPQAGEPSVVVTDYCSVSGTRTANPRDGVVTIIAVADGEEGFFDANGNGIHDPGEAFIDQGEPFVDANDNGVYDDGTAPGSVPEVFVDLNGNGAWDGPNGQWDANTKIWTQTVVVYTGLPDTMQASATPTFVGTRWIRAADYTNACAGTPRPPAFGLAIEQPGPPPVPGGTGPYVVVASDVNLNPPHMGTTYDVTSLNSIVKVTYDGLSQYADGLGFFYRYWPCDQAGACAAQCTAADAVCEMKPAVMGFGCGIHAAVAIQCGTKAGADRVDYTVTTPYTVYDGMGKNVIVPTSISGSCN